jgi:hypothetical protein
MRLRPKKFEIQKIDKTVKERGENPTKDIHEIEPNPSKVRTMYEKDNRSF